MEEPRSERAASALSSLWEALFGEPPPIVADPSLTARVLVESLPSIGPYRLGITRSPLIPTQAGTHAAVPEARLGPPLARG